MYASIVKQIRKAYELAGTAAAKPLPEMYLESLRIEQGCWTQAELHELGSSYEGHGVIASMQPNARKRSHLEIETDRLLVTTHRVRHPGQFPQHAEYRETNAASNQQWLPGLADPQVHEGAKCNLHILHGPSEEDPAQLGFVQLAVPTSGQRSYLSIMDLFSCDDFQPVSTEEQVPEVQIRLKKAKSSKQSS